MDRQALTELYLREKAKLEGLKRAKGTSPFSFGFRKAIREQKQVVKELKQRLDGSNG